MRKTKIYEVLKTLPKGVLHNVFFDTCEDRAFVFQDIFSIDKLFPSTLMYTLHKILFHLELEQKRKLGDMVGYQWKKEENFIEHKMILLKLFLP